MQKMQTGFQLKVKFDFSFVEILLEDSNLISIFICLSLRCSKFRVHKITTNPPFFIALLTIDNLLTKIDYSDCGTEPSNNLHFHVFFFLTIIPLKRYGFLIVSPLRNFTIIVPSTNSQAVSPL